MADGKHYQFFSHTQCEYFPCHPTKHPEDFNCLFCYCPLYFLGDKCGGNFTYTQSGIKNCIDCMVPHRRENYGYVMEKLRAYNETVKQASAEESGIEP